MMAERAFNARSLSYEDMAREWRATPAPLLEILTPFRQDGEGYPAVRFDVTIDLKLLRMASDDDPHKALRFILSEVRAAYEGLAEAVEAWKPT